MKENLLQLLENSRTYTINIAKAMPAKGHEFKPAEGSWNFRELLSHMAYGIQWWESNYVKGIKMDWEQPKASATTSDAIRKIESAFDALRDTIIQSNVDEKLIHGFHAALDHITHHRGQATVYLRCNGVTPVDYVY